MSNQGLSRRTVLFSAAGMAATVPGLSTTPSDARDTWTTDDAFEAYVKMRGSFSTEPLYWWYKSITYGQMGRDIKPLVALELAAFSQYELNSDGTVTATSREVGYFLSLDSGEVLETWRNPYTGKLIEMGHIKGGPRQLLITPDGLRGVGGLPEGSKFDLSFRPPFVVGDHVYIMEEAHGTIVSVTRDESGDEVTRDFQTDEFTTFSAPLAEVADASLPTAPSTRFAFHNMLGWPVWMGMGDSPGNTMGRGQGGRVRSMAELPSTIRKPIAERDPLFFRDPGSWSKPKEHVPIFGQD